MNSIIIVDPHTLCREALCSYIRHIDQNLSVAGFSDAGEFAAYMKGEEAGLVIFDQDLPESDRRHLQGCKTAMILRTVNEDMMLDPAIHGVFLRGLSSKAFLAGVHDILAGGTFFSSEEELTPEPAGTVRAPPQDFSLTVREKEVLSYLVKGQSNKDIARALDLQVVTVKLHVRGICRKMRAGNRTQAALIAKENGWS